ncbi:MAG: hypothetical protein HW421_381 [Ignavibacteria bacterium]|nr:hypothetical protein [Ignavibacteria bacterium]
MKNFSIIVPVLLFFLATGCHKENSTTPSNQSSYFPITSGSNWIYDYYTLDSMNNRTNIKPTLDSTAITGNSKMLEKDCKILSSFEFNNGAYTKGPDSYWRTEATKTYVHSNIFSAMLAMPIMPITLEDKWLKIFDFDNSDGWLVLVKDIDTLMFGLPLKGSLQALGSLEEMKTITVPYGSMMTYHFLIRVNFNGNIAAPVIGTVPINFTRKMHFYIAENIGIVKRFYESSSISIPLMGGFSMPGEEANLIRFNIGK